MTFKRNAGFIDRTVLVAANGDTLELHGASRRYTLTEEDYGMPPIEYVSQRGIFQDGETVLAQYLRPRPVQLVVRWSACSRAEYWNNRGTLLEFVRPARSGPIPTGGTMSLRKYLANGKVRQLDVVPDSTPVFGPRDLNTWDEFAFSEALKFIAHSPTWYDPVRKTAQSGAISPLTSLSYFTELWSSGTLDATKWQDASVTIPAVPGSGRVVLATSGAQFSEVFYIDYPTPSTYTMLDSYWFVDLAVPPTVAGSALSTEIDISDGSSVSTWSWMYVQCTLGGNFVIHLNVFGTGTDVFTMPYDPVAHRYLLVTFSATAIKWWVSADAITWTLVHSEAKITSPAAVCNFYDLSLNSVATDSATFGQVNLPGPLPSGVPSAKIVATCNYAGTWKEFPIIVVTGPVTDPVIVNNDTGESISFTGGLAVSGGQTLTIDLTYGRKTADLSGGGGSAIGYLAPASNFGEFHLAPAPEVANGLNHIELTGSGTDSNTATTVQWYDRFIGI